MPKHVTTLIHHKQLKPVHHLVEHETVLPSQNDDYHPMLADFGNDEFSFCNNIEGVETINKPLASFPLEALQRFQSQSKKPIKMPNFFLHRFLIPIDTDITDNDDPFEKRISPDDTPFQSTYLLFRRIIINKQPTFHWLIIHLPLENNQIVRLEVDNCKLS